MDVNGMTPSILGQPGKKCTSYKLLVDPNIKKNCQKLIRYDGIVPGQMGQALSVKFVKDPRSRLTRLWRDTEIADLPIPKMKFDEYFVGELPPKQITFTNLNDNVREPFLRSMAEKHGKVEDITIYRHPKTSKHLGLASVTYTSTRFARQAALEMNRTSVMGKIIIVQIDAGGKECQRIFDCLVADKPSTPSSIGSTPRVDPRNGTPLSGPDTPQKHNDPRRLSLEKQSSMVTDTPASSVSSLTPGFMPPESQGSFPAFVEQPVQQFQGIPDQSNPQFQMPEQPSQQDMLMHSMNSVTLQGYEHMQNVYAAQQAAQLAQQAQQAGYAQQHVEQIPRTTAAGMYAQQTPVRQVQEGFTMPQTPSVPPVPDQHLLYGHQQHPVIPQDPSAVNFQATQPYQTQPMNVQGYSAHELPIQNQAEMPGYSSSGAVDNSKQYQKVEHAQSSKKQNYMARGESHHAHSEESQESFHSRPYQSHSGRGQRHSNLSGSKRYDDDRGSKRFDDDRSLKRFDDDRGSKRFDDDRGSKRYDDDRGSKRYDDRSKKWDRRDRQDYHSNKRNERQRYRSQDNSEENDEDGGSNRQKDHRRGNFRSRDSGDRHRFDDSYHKKSFHRKDNEEDEHESSRGHRAGSKSRGYDNKYSDSRTHRDKKKTREFDKEESGDYFAKWRCPTMKDQEVKPKEESYEFDKWEMPKGKSLPPVPVRETNKFDQCHPPGEEPPSTSPEDVSPFEEWQCPPGEEPPPGTMPLVLPSQPFPPGVQEAPLPSMDADKVSQSEGEDTDGFALSLDTRIEKLLKSSQGPMAGFPGIQLEDSGNAGKNSSTNTLPPPGTEEPTFSQSEESVRTSDPETNTNYMKPEEQWGRYRQEQHPRTDHQAEHQWTPGHLPHSHVPDPVHHPRLDHLKPSANGNDAFARPHSTPTPPGRQSASATPPPGKMSQGVELLISKQLQNLRNYDQQTASRDTSPISDVMRDRSQTSTPGIEDYHMHRGPMQYTPMDTAADDDDDKMSLSSLSSGDDTKIVVNVPIPEKKPQAPGMNSIAYATSQASWTTNLNQRSTNVVNAWAAQMMPPSSAGNATQMNLQGQNQTSGYRPNPMFPRGPPPSLQGMRPQASMEAFLESMQPPSSSSHEEVPTNAQMMQMMQMMASLGMPPPSIGPDGLPDFKPEQFANLNFPGQLNPFNSLDMLPFNMPPGFPSASAPPWMAAPFMPPIPESLLPSSLDKPHRDPEKELVNEVLKTVIQEMKIIMKKDLNRKMVESKAFKSFESWWDTCQLMAKAKQMMKPKEEEKVPKKPPPAIPSMLESSFSAFGMEGLGLGLRANMPRMPSFKVKRKAASPSPNDEVDDVDDDVKAVDKKRPFTPPVIDEDSDDMSDTEQDEITEISSQTSEPQVLDRRERAKRAREFIYSSSSDDDEEDDDDKEDAELEKELEDDDDDDEDEEDEEDEEEDEEDEEEDEEEEDEELEEDEVITKEVAKTKLEKAPSRKDEVTADDLDKEEESQDTQESETPSKVTLDKPSLSDASDVDSDEDWTESSSSSETESSSSESDTESSDSDEDDVEGKAPSIEKSAAEEKEDRLGAFEILVEMATKAKDKLDQSSSDNDKGVRGDVDMEMSDIQAAQSLTALRHASETSEVGEMTAFKGETSATMDDSSEKTMSGSEGDVDVGDYKNLLTKQLKIVLEPLAIVDHTYCQKPTPSPDKVEPAPAAEELKKQEVLTEKITNLIPEVKYVTVDKEKDKEEKQRQKVEKAEKKKARKRKNELAKILEEEIVIVPEPKAKEFKLRNYYEEWTLLYEFLRSGITHEDAYLIRKSYETLLEAGNFPWLSYTHWMAHPLTACPDPPQPKRKKLDEESRVHLSGSSRTEGYYKISNKEKVKYLTKARTYVQESVTDSSALDESTTKKRIEVSRDARSDQRRFIAVLQQQEEQVSNLFKFNQLQFRKKDIKFCKSSIHGWGLYAMEPIAADEMVIEYVGESVRQSIADSREKAYERMGIGSSYLFRIDAVTIIDATKSGNLARFINHSCNPNCYAKIITVESEKKIVIYSKQTINVGDEITYDYKFPIEDEKISCLCGAPQCRGTLN